MWNANPIGGKLSLRVADYRPLAVWPVSGENHEKTAVRSPTEAFERDVSSIKTEFGKERLVTQASVMQ
jgi:hypothetical protein